MGMKFKESVLVLLGITTVCGILVLFSWASILYIIGNNGDLILLFCGYMVALAFLGLYIKIRLRAEEVELNQDQAMLVYPLTIILSALLFWYNGHILTEYLGPLANHKRVLLWQSYAYGLLVSIYCLNRIIDIPHLDRGSVYTRIRRIFTLNG